jgi:hypothetical protein
MNDSSLGNESFQTKFDVIRIKISLALLESCLKMRYLIQGPASILNMCCNFQLVLFISPNNKKTVESVQIVIKTAHFYKIIPEACKDLLN